MLLMRGSADNGVLAFVVNFREKKWTESKAGNQNGKSNDKK